VNDISKAKELTMFILTSSTLTIEPTDAHLIGAVGNPNPNPPLGC